MNKKLKIGIPTALYNNTFGLDVRYIEWCNQFGTPVLLTPFLNQYDLFDVLFLPGGADIAVSPYTGFNTSELFNIGRSNSHLEWFDASYIYRCIRNKRPIIGVCRGFQRINVEFGGTLKNLYGEELKLHQQNKDEDTKNSLVHTCDIVHKSYQTSDWINEIRVNSIHHQAIDKLGDGLEVLVKCGDVIEAFKHKNLPVIGFQWHPEKIWDKFSEKVVKDILEL